MSSIARALGLPVAAVVVLSAALAWPAGTEPLVAAGIGVAVAVAFLARRHGRLPRATGAVLAGATSGLAVGYGLYALTAVSADLLATPGPVVAGLGGLGGIALAVADWFAIPDDRFGRMLTETGAGTAIGVLGLAATQLWGVLLYGTLLLASGAIQAVPEPGDIALQVVGTLGLGLGMATAAAGYLVYTEQGRSYVDLARPRLRDAAYVVGGILALFAVLYAVSWLLAALETGTAEHGIVEDATGGSPEILLALIPLSILVVGPAEELLFRNVIQKSLYGPFSRWGAILVGSVIFAAVHLPAYATSTAPLEVLSSLAIVGCLSVLLGWLYARTENLLVPALVHGVFNAGQFLLLYVQLTG